MSNEPFKSPDCDMSESGKYADVTLAYLPLAGGGIRIDGGTQSRVGLDQEVVDEYADFIRQGGTLPPIVVFDDGVELWLASGFHRYHAHLAAVVAEIHCEVHMGSQRDAILYSVGSNATHGLRRSNADKRKSVLTLLDDAEWSQWSGEEIAKKCGVSAMMVSRLRSEAIPISNNVSDKVQSRLAKRNGKTFSLSTANIGRGKKAGVTLSEENTTDVTVSAFYGIDENVVTDCSAPPEMPDVAFPSGSQLEQLRTENLALTVRVAKLEADLVNGDIVHAGLRAEMAKMATALKSVVDDNDSMRKVIDADDRVAVVFAQCQLAERLAKEQQSKVDRLAEENDHLKHRCTKAEEQVDKVKRQQRRGHKKEVLDMLRNSKSVAA